MSTVTHGSRSGDEVLVATAEDCLTLTVNRPHRLNAVTPDVLHDLADQIDAATESGTRVIVLTGAGESFGSGADLNPDDAAAMGTLDAGNRLVRSIHGVPVPVVAAVRGPAAGISVPIALACDLVVARDDSYFLLPFTRIGLMPDGGATALVAASVGRATAMRMALLADKLPALDALTTGLIAAVWAADDYESRLAALTARLAAGPSDAYAATKRAINEATVGGLNDVLDRETEEQTGLLGSADFREGVAAFNEKRPPRFGGR